MQSEPPSKPMAPHFRQMHIRLFAYPLTEHSIRPHPQPNNLNIPSNVNTLEAFVPTTAPTVTFEYDVISVVGALSRHCAVVAEDQDVVPQSTSTTACPVGVKPYTPKLSPEIVTVAPPDVAALTGTS